MRVVWTSVGKFGWLWVDVMVVLPGGGREGESWSGN